jgi:hypothetical protein
MTQHILMIWMATAVAAFSALAGSTTKGRVSKFSSAADSRTGFTVEVKIEKEAAALVLDEAVQVEKVHVVAEHLSSA